jgi:hypothetical protein
VCVCVCVTGACEKHRISHSHRTTRHARVQAWVSSNGVRVVVSEVVSEDNLVCIVLLSERLCLVDLGCTPQHARKRSRSTTGTSVVVVVVEVLTALRELSVRLEIPCFVGSVLENDVTLGVLVLTKSQQDDVTLVDPHLRVSYSIALVMR